MDDAFQIPVTYKGEDLLFNASLKAYGYVHKIEVDVNGQTIIYEQDEEGLYRAVVPYEDALNSPNVNVELLGLIATVLNTV